MSEDFLEETNDDIIIGGFEHSMSHQERYEFVKKREYYKDNQLLDEESALTGTTTIKSYWERRKFLRNSEFGKFLGFPQDK